MAADMTESSTLDLLKICNDMYTAKTEVEGVVPRPSSESQQSIVDLRNGFLWLKSENERVHRLKMDASMKSDEIILSLHHDVDDLKQIVSNKDIEIKTLQQRLGALKQLLDELSRESTKSPEIEINHYLETHPDAEENALYYSIFGGAKKVMISPKQEKKSPDLLANELKDMRKKLKNVLKQNEKQREFIEKNITTFTSTSQVDNERLHTLEAELAAANELNISLTMELNAAHEAVTELLGEERAKITELENQIHINKAIASGDQEVHDLREKVAELEKQLDKDKAIITEQEAQLQLTREQEGGELAKLNKQLDEKTAKVNEVERKLELVALNQGEYPGLDAGIEAAAINDQDFLGLSEGSAKVERQSDAKKATIAELETELESTQKQKEEEIANLEEQLKSAKDEIKSMHAENEEIITNHNKVIQDLQKELAVEVVCRDKLKLELRKMQSNLLKAEASKSDVEKCLKIEIDNNSDMRQKLERAACDIENLKKAFKEQTIDSECNFELAKEEYGREIEALRTENQRVKDELMIVEDEVNELRHLKDIALKLHFIREVTSPSPGNISTPSVKEIKKRFERRTPSPKILRVSPRPSTNSDPSFESAVTSKFSSMSHETFATSASTFSAHAHFESVLSRDAKRTFSPKSFTYNERVSATIICALLRGFLARRKVSRMKECFPHVLSISLNANNLSHAEDPSQLMPSTYVVLGFMTGTDREECFSAAQSQVCRNSCNPVYPNSVSLSVEDRRGPIVLSVFSKNPDAFLGQAVIKLEDYPEIYQRYFFSKELVLHEAKIAVYDSDGRVKDTSGFHEHIQGSITLTLRVPEKFERRLCGWFWRQKKTLFFESFEKVWVVIVNTQVIIYDTPYLKTQLQRYPVSMVLRVERVQIEKDGTQRSGLHIKLSKGEDLRLVWGDLVAEYKGVWIQGFVGGADDLIG